jgi:hypothetical protein
MEKRLQDAEAALEPFALRMHVMALAAHRPQFNKEFELRFLFLCQRLREKMRVLMPSR